MIPTPWNIENNHNILFSPCGKMKVQYRNLYEFAMGSPLVGEAIIEVGKLQYLVDEMCACPPVWSSTSQLLAIPIWTQGRAQEIGIIDVQKFEMRISRATYRVVHFASFCGNVLHGTDSPLHQPKNFAFDIRQMGVRATVRLRCLNLLV